MATARTRKSEAAPAKESKAAKEEQVEPAAPKRPTTKPGSAPAKAPAATKRKATKTGTAKVAASKAAPKAEKPTEPEPPRRKRPAEPDPMSEAEAAFVAWSTGDVSGRQMAFQRLVHLGHVGAEAVRRALAKEPTPERVRLLSRLGRPDEIRRLRELARHVDPAVRLAAVEALGERRSREALPELLHALSDGQAEVADRAQAELARFDPDEARTVVVAWLGSLRQLKAAERTGAVLRAGRLGLVGFDGIGPFLLDALGEANAAWRREAAEQLGVFGTEARAALPRVRAARKDTDAATRDAVEAALRRIEAKGR